MTGASLLGPKRAASAPAGRRPLGRPVAGWLLVLLTIPAGIAALLSDRQLTPQPKRTFEVGILPQDRAWLCQADGAAGCSAQDFVRAYRLEGPEYRAVGNLLLQRIGPGTAFDPRRAVILNEKQKCPEGAEEKCHGQISGL